MLEEVLFPAHTLLRRSFCSGDGDSQRYGCTSGTLAHWGYCGGRMLAYSIFVITDLSILVFSSQSICLSNAIRLHLTEANLLL